MSDDLFIGLAGDVVLERTYRFTTNLYDTRRLRYYQREPAGAPVEPVGEVTSGHPAELRIYTQQPGDPLNRFLWEVEGELSDLQPLSVRLTLPLRAANADSPLSYSLYFESAEQAAYTLRICPPFPSVTLPERFSITGTPVRLLENLHRVVADGMFVTSGTVTIAENISEPVGLHIEHSQELASTKLMTYYATDALET